MKKMKLFINKRRMILLILLLLTTVSFYHVYKQLPKGISVESPVYMTDQVELLVDLTYKDPKGNVVHEQTIFNEIYKTIENAEDFIVIDMFLFNGYTDGNGSYPLITEKLTTTILNQKNKFPNLEIYVITDEINTTYGSHSTENIETLRNHGIHITYTNLNRLRDSNPLYSTLWRVMFQWFGQEGLGWIENPLAETAPKVTLRSYLKLMNLKANHRKVIVTEDAAIISSANAHDQSGYHSNIAFKVTGKIIKEVLKSEEAVIKFSGKNTNLVKGREFKETKGNTAVQLLTEGKIQKHTVMEINNTNKTDVIWLGMFYLSDRNVIEALKDAAKRGVKIKLVLDPNQNAFGSEKMGLPNLPVAAELIKLQNENIDIRWYDTSEEQYHSKVLYIKKKNEAVIIGGSANFTGRNLNNYNLETDIKIRASKQTEVAQKIDAYFQKIWMNKNGSYTVEYETYQDKLPLFKYILYLIQKVFRFTTY